MMLSVANVFPPSLYRSELLRFCSLSGKPFQYFFILTNKRLFSMDHCKSLVLHVELITSCPIYHGDSQKFPPTHYVSKLIHRFLPSFIDVSSLWTGLGSRQIQDWQEWVIHEQWLTKLSSLSGHSTTSFYLFQVLHQKKGLQEFFYTCFDIPSWSLNGTLQKQIHE